MNVLLITYSFPPAAGVGVLRALSLAKYLPENGIHVEVLTARNAAAVGRDPALLRQVPDTVQIHRTWTLDLPFALRKFIKKLVSRPRNPTATATFAAAAPSRPNPLKLLLGNLLLPDPQVGWLPFAFRAARRLIVSRHIDLVLITVPPFSTVRLVTRLRRAFPHLPIVLDFRDEWLTTTINLVSFNNNARARAIAHTAESEAVRDATAVVCVTDSAAAELRTRYPAEPPTKFHCIPNGFDTPLRSPAPQVAPDTAVLTYIGTVYGSTDPTPVVEAILQLSSAIRDRLHLRFIGHIETPDLRETLLRLGATVELIPFLPQAEALRYIDTTTYLLLITHDPINVAAKLYDYLSSGRPILAAVHPTGDVRRTLDATRAGWSADINDPEALVRLFTEAVDRLPTVATVFHPDVDTIRTYTRAALSTRYAALLRTLVETRPS